MNAVQMKNELEAIIASATKLRDRIAAEEKIAPMPVLMRVAAYAKHAGVSANTVRAWVKAGLPVRRRGGLILIVVAEADMWSEDAATRRSAERTAHGAKT